MFSENSLDERYAFVTSICHAQLTFGNSSLEGRLTQNGTIYYYYQSKLPTTSTNPFSFSFKFVTTGN